VYDWSNTHYEFYSYDCLNIRNPFLCIMMPINSVTEAVHKVGPNSEVSTATSYGPDGPCVK